MNIDPKGILQGLPKDSFSTVISTIMKAIEPTSPTEDMVDLPSLDELELRKPITMLRNGCGIQVNNITFQQMGLRHFEFGSGFDQVGTSLTYIIDISFSYEENGQLISNTVRIRPKNASNLVMPSVSNEDYNFLISFIEDWMNMPIGNFSYDTFDYL